VDRGNPPLLNLIGGLMKSSTGTIYVKEIELSQMSESDLALFRRQYIGFTPFYDLFQFVSYI
jgi:putative ABC transport system ATP-binding protein